MDVYNSLQPLGMILEDENEEFTVEQKETPRKVPLPCGVGGNKQRLKDNTFEKEIPRNLLLSSLQNYWVIGK